MTKTTTTTAAMLLKAAASAYNAQAQIERDERKANEQAEEKLDAAYAALQRKMLCVLCEQKLGQVIEPDADGPGLTLGKGLVLYASTNRWRYVLDLKGPEKQRDPEFWRLFLHDRVLERDWFVSSLVSLQMALNESAEERQRLAEYESEPAYHEEQQPSTTRRYDFLSLDEMNDPDRRPFEAIGPPLYNEYHGEACAFVEYTDGLWETSEDET